MLTFEPFLEEVIVKICDITIGLIETDGFFFMRSKGILISSDNLHQIAVKTREVAQYGIDPPKCPDCHNTPYFPDQKFVLENDVVVICSNEIHSKQFVRTGDWLR